MGHNSVKFELADKPSNSGAEASTDNKYTEKNKNANVQNLMLMRSFPPKPESLIYVWNKYHRESNFINNK